MKLGLITYFAKDKSHGYLIEITSLKSEQIRKDLSLGDKSKSYYFKPSNKQSDLESEQIIFFEGNTDGKGRNSAKIIYSELKSVLTQSDDGIFVSYITDSNQLLNQPLKIPANFQIEKETLLASTKIRLKREGNFFKLHLLNCKNETRTDDTYKFWTKFLKTIVLKMNQSNTEELWPIIEKVTTFLKTIETSRFELSSTIEIVCKNIYENKYLDGVAGMPVSSFLFFWLDFKPELVKISRILDNINFDETTKAELWILDIGSFEELELDKEYFNQSLLPELLVKDIIYQNSFLIKMKEIGKADLFLRPILTNRIERSPHPIISLKNEIQFINSNFYEDKSTIIALLIKNLTVTERLSLFNEEVIDELPLYIDVRKEIETVPLELINKIINKYSFEEQLDLFGEFCFRTKKPDLLYKTLIDGFNFSLNEINFSVLDTEFDGYTIKEIAWTNKGEIIDCNSEHLIKENQSMLETTLKDSSVILVGHNLIDFDIPLLSRVYNFTPNAQLVDSLVIETSLNPIRNSFALKTGHTAKEDIEVTRQLFINQMFRLILREDDFFENESSTLPSSLKDLLFKWRESIKKYPKEFNQYVNNKSQSFFISNNALHEKASLVEESILKLSEETKYVIISPKQYWPLIAHFQNIQFLGADTDFGKVISVEKVDIISESKEKEYLKAFINDCLESNRLPLLINLPSRIRFLVEKNNAVLSFTEEVKGQFGSKSNLCILPSQVEEFENIITNEEYRLVVLDPELISITNKHFLGAIEHAVFENRFNKDSFWLYFTGGESRVQISKSDVEGFGFVNSNKALKNFWIEKNSFDRYSIWGSYDLIDWLNNNKGKKSINAITSEMLSASEGTCNIVFTKRNGKGGFNITRLNPETRYRDRYWLVQGEYIKSIVSSNNRPAIVLIRNKKEIIGLRNYFLEENYFVPDPISTTFRQIELLINHENHFKVCFFSEDQLVEIINSGLVNEFNIIIDSFELEEKWYISQGSSYFEAAKTAPSETNWKKSDNDVEETIESVDEEEDSIQDEESTESSAKDIFLLLKLQKPILDFYRWLINQTGNNNLWLLDSRLEDFSGLQETWRAKIVRFSLWSKEDDYKKAFKKIRIHLQSPQIIGELDINIDAAINALQEIFLKIKGKQHHWREEQIEYLTEILKRKDDLLISMPTGGGKSLLFQGPSLYRGSLSGRLTIVVTPLKALMEDQADALWSRGLYGSVDYINSDRRNEIQYIYRRIAGGETLLLFITPERFRSRAFINALTLRIENDGGLEYAVYDEAHCVSQWGLDFRPDYLNSTKVMNLLKVTTESKFPVLLFSATASKQIINDFDKLFA